MRRARVLVSGRVQGVGYRVSAASRARSLDLVGWIRNLHDGRVEAVFEGEPERVVSMVEWCGRGPGGARVDGVDVTWEEPAGGDGFQLR